MRARDRLMIGALFGAIIMAASWHVGTAQDDDAVATNEPTDESTIDDLTAIKQRIESYLSAYNAKDWKAVSEHWTVNGVYIDQSSGVKIQGREALAKSMKESFESDEAGKLECELQSLDLISPGVALEQGVSFYTVGDNEQIVTTYSAVHLKGDDQWYIDRISEKEYVEPPSNYDHLKPLEWLIGQWSDQNGEAVISTECHWARNENFIIRSFTIALTDEIEMAGMQIIGWDPAQEELRSWTFDSDGGFNEGVWTESDGAWSVQTTATLPDGSLGSSTTMMKPIDEATFTWQQINRVVDGELLPNLSEVVIARQAEE